MNDYPEEFELSTLRAILEQLHDAGIDYQPETVDKMNEIREVAWKYVRSRDLTPEQWKLVRSLLSHPKAMVRVWVATELLFMGSTDVWQTLIGEAEPRPPRADQPLEEWMRDANARHYAGGYLYFAERTFTSLKLRPTYAEITAQWTAEGKW